MSDDNQTMENIVIHGDANLSPVQNLRDITYALDQSAIVAITDRTGKIIFVNDLFSKISKYSKEELVGQPHRIVSSGYHSRAFFKEMWATIGRGETWRGEICNRAKDGEVYWVNTTIVPFLNEKGKPYQYISIRSDVTFQKKMEEQVRRSSEMYRLITNNSSDFISIIDVKGNFKYVSPSYEKLLGFNLEKLTANNLCSIIVEDDQDLVRAELKPFETIELSVKSIEFRVKSALGNVLCMEATINQVQDVGEYQGDIVLVMRDVTARKESERMIDDLVDNDQLTELLNRTAFRKKIYEEIEWANKHQLNFGFIYFNIDRLRYVNDSLGHDAGDYVISVVAKRLKEVLRYDDPIGRIAGDEFAFIIRDVTDAEHAIRIATEIQSYVEEPIDVAGQSYVLSTSCGIALYPEHAKSPSELVMKSEKALHNVKAHGGNGYELYQHGTAKKTLERILLENEMRKSVELDYFYLDYQPKVNLKSGELIGVEALVRWNHPDLGRIRPDKFIPVAEETKLILPLGEWVLLEACKQAKKWQDKGYMYSVAVNISAVQIEEPTFLATVQEILTVTGVDPTLIEFELTESSFADRGGMQAKITEIKKLGITVSIDDFGTGYSTFSYIKELSADTLKIDMAFVRDIHLNEESRAIVRAILSLANTVGLNVIAEGIELQEQIDILLSYGCNEGQGYFFSRPTTPELCEEMMKTRSVRE